MLGAQVDGMRLALKAASLDAAQSAALAACRPGARVSIVGAPGSGKTSILGALLLREIHGVRSRIAVIAQDRRAAALLRNQVALAAGGLGDSVSVQTLAAFSFRIVQAYAQAVGRKDPELIAGPDEDTLLAAIIEDEETGIEFPDFVTPEVRVMSSFRAEVRDLMTRARELDYSPDDLERLAAERNEPMWRAGAQIMRLYDAITEAQDAFSGFASSPDRLDHAQLVGTAAHIIAEWDAHVEAAAEVPGHIERPSWDWILVDDLQNAPRSILSLLRELARDGASIVTAGDPDSAVQGFRGGVASLPGDICRPEPVGLGAEAFVLDHVYRGGARLADVARRVTSCARVSGGMFQQRNYVSGTNPDHVSGQRFIHHEEEIAGIAHYIRHLHLVEGIRYSDIAIITRSRSSHAAMRRSLVRRHVPVEQIGSDRPLREQPAVAALMGVIRIALGIDSQEHLREVLVSPLLGIDPLSLSRMERTLRGYELANGGKRNVTELLSLVLEEPHKIREFVPSGIDDLVRATEVFAAIKKAAVRHNRQAEQVLWAAWEACGRSEQWRTIALEGGVEGDAADANLDAVIQLFRVAQRMADRNPVVAIDLFLEEVDSQDLPEDSIARAGAAVDAVTLTTPSASIGRSWNHVVISGLQDGIWPNLKLRDTYTHTSRLTQIATGREVGVASPEHIRSEAFGDVLDDELRQLLHSVTRANQSLLITCVENDDEQPSRFVTAMGFTMEESSENTPEGIDDSPLGEPVMSSPAPLRSTLDLIEVIGELRRALKDPHSSPQEIRAATWLLDELRAGGVAAADPELWIDERTVGEDPEPVNEVSISPSSVEKLLDCPLKGFLSTVGGERNDGRPEAKVGTLIHSLAERFPEGGKEQLLRAFDEEWHASFGDPGTSTISQYDYEKRRAQVQHLADVLNDLPPAAETETFLSVDLNGIAQLNAAIDRISIDADGRARIYDFKTGHTINYKDAEDHTQLQLYQWALTVLAERGQPHGVKPASAELIFLEKEWNSSPNKRWIQGALSDRDRVRAEQRISSAVKVLSLSSFPANPSDATCRNCPFTTVCPAKPEGAMFS